MTFEKGVPTAVNGEKMKVSDIIRTLNKIGGKHGIGIIDIVENRVVGMKSRGVYETPGGTILMEAHMQLEELCLDRDTMDFKKDVANRLAQLVYEGKWFTPLTQALVAFTKEIGCELAQGFYYHRPESLEEILYRVRGGEAVKPCESPEERESCRQRCWEEDSQ
jgi:argininosuccinate synthase